MKILLTGATGFLGQELYSQLKVAGYDVLGLSRHGPDIIGDITQHDFGLTSPPHVDAMIHSAALLSFSDRDREDLFRVNSRGALAVCNYCIRHSVPKLIHIFTAYICGDYQGSWGEGDLYKGQHFRNPYEESKFWGETYMREASRNLEVTIFRPSILIGRSTDGKTSTFGGFYRPLEALARVIALVEKKLHLPSRENLERSLHLPKLPVPVTIKGDPDSTLNLVPVDWVAQNIIALMNKDGTFHLTDQNPLTNREICEMVCEVLGVMGPHFDKEAKLRQPHDRLYNRMIRDFSPYLQQEPSFSSSLSPSLHLTGDDKEFILEAIRYWRRTEDHGYQGVPEGDSQYRSRQHQEVAGDGR